MRGTVPAVHLSYISRVCVRGTLSAVHLCISIVCMRGTVPAVHVVIYLEYVLGVQYLLYI